jgi:hypothetical protein
LRASARLCDESEERFQEALRTIAKRLPPSKTAAMLARFSSGQIIEASKNIEGRAALRLKIRWWQHRAGSSPARGTN